MGYLLIGPVTQDKNIIEGNEILKVGGPVYYQSKVFSKLGIEHAAIITLSREDKKLLDEFPQETMIIPLWGDNTLEFENRYFNHGKRMQRSNFAKNPITAKDIKPMIKYEWDGIILDPLVPTDIPIQTLEFIANQQDNIYLGLQGYLRRGKDGRVYLRPPENIKGILGMVDKVFLDEEEAGIFKPDLVEAAMFLGSMGPSETIITCGERGSIIYSNGRIWRIKAVPASRILDPTGLGDVYMAAYIHMREKRPPGEAGEFASWVATEKIEGKLLDS
ncbi:MAG TPA: ribokinase [Methanothermobacter sp.]|uniref:Ribokinase n=1 Tax=Methanothermobacter tenebrarum TaxID=680118 RepID=A0ABM7YE04_9EURY|nr:PfkB family carbohydrate kinase [Methanothermobacter tenebrarum]MDD3454560.1 PfkB family carbohydrate kinase [Methanobacteriales archaeon]MDI6881365.1 PfkB family carbohydrate kinase [Methanothermobacter sp.]MDX9693285.1 PfkB family carbohydrate kinase [Methanothermobacter sp.]BDH79639.1 ribokinase [Methanothermobacter tenebrarum]HHW15901.1 ribokinase [Methanothermobacter sp.]